MIATALVVLQGAFWCSQAPAGTIRCMDEELPARLVFGDTFADMCEWSNLTANTRWHVEDGQLIGHWAPGGSTIWSNREFSGDLYIRFRARLLEPADDWRTEKMPDGGKNVNFRFLVSGPGGRDIREVYRDLAAERTGPNHTGDDQYEGYFFTWTWSHTRLRRSPGYVNVSERRDVLPAVGVEYTVEVLKEGGRIRYAVNGEVLHDYRDEAPFDSGRVGFTLWHSRLAVDFIEVYELGG